MSIRPLRRALLLALAALGLLAVPASALAAPPRIGGIVADLPSGHVAVPQRHAVLARAADVSNQDGGPVLHSNRTHLVFWAPAGSGLGFDSGYALVMERFLTRVAADSRDPRTVYGLTGQYGDGSGPAAYASSYGGAVLDTDPLPASDCTEPASGPAGWSVCLTDDELEQELGQLVGTRHLPHTGTDIYFLVLPDGLGSCIDGSAADGCALGGASAGYCGYHGVTATGLLYAVIPYNAVPGHCQSDNPRPNASSADPALSTISHEQMETITDPEPYDSWAADDLEEIGDLCLTQFGPAVGGRADTAWNESIAGGHYWLQEEWSNEDSACEPRVDPDSASVARPAAWPPAGRSRSAAGRAIRTVGSSPTRGGSATARARRAAVHITCTRARGPTGSCSGSPTAPVTGPTRSAPCASWVRPHPSADARRAAPARWQPAPGPAGRPGRRSGGGRSRGSGRRTSRGSAWPPSPAARRRAGGERSGG